ncbi:hypothetical protein [Microbacterium foliorum]|uniref:hypothetical protein n=1 Tax=Microbacterium foliorum TaxID=104336 RepID=UPI0028CFDEA4|nr:hypothetical protein [Microbacterium foliorum]
MHSSYALAPTSSADAAWAKARAAREIRAAIDALDDAAAALRGLAVDTRWHSGGVTALRETLTDIARRVGAEAADARDREAEVARIDAA